MRKWIPWFFVLAALAASVILYPRLPNPMPVHWNWRGVADGWAPTLVGVLAMPILMVALVALFHFLPRLDPMRANYERFWPEYQLMIVAITGMVAAMHAAMLAIALGYQIPIIKVAMVLVGVLFIVLGNIMPRIRRNHTAGFRTKATLSNEVVWSRTHRAGGAMMMITGVVIALGALAPSTWGIAIIMVSVLVMSVMTFRYSNRIAREVNAEQSPGEGATSA
jgi:uncharacterized membrane protein